MRNFQFRAVMFLGAVLLMVLAVVSPANAVVAYRTVVLSGDAAPGTGPDAMFIFFNTPVINDAGQVAFRGFLSGGSVESENDSGLWSEGAGSLSLMAREGYAAAGTDPGVTYKSINVYLLNAAGQTTFMASLRGTGVSSTNDNGIWAKSSGPVGLVIQKGDAAAGTGPGAVYNDLISFRSSSESGQVAFQSGLSGAGIDDSNNAGIWSGSAGSLGLVARKGAAAPDTGPGVLFGGFGTPVINRFGQVAVNGSLTGEGVDGTNDSAIWSEGSGTLSMIAREGSPAAGAGPGVDYWFLSQPDLNDAGQTAFYGGLTGAGVDETNNRGLWSDGSGQLDLLARSGQPAPGTEPGVLFSDFDRPVINGPGHTAFNGNLTGVGVDSTNDAGIWSDVSGSLDLLARTGNPAPGVEPGGVFADLHISMINGTGQIAFKAPLSGAGVDTSNEYGVWATDPTGQLTLIARMGDLFDVNDDPLIDDLRTISIVAIAPSIGGGEDGRASSFNLSGQLAIKLGFTDGSYGIFVAETRLPGDLNGDGFVGIADLNLVLGNWNLTVPPGDALADPSGDNFVGIADLNVVLGNWNAGTPPGGASGNIPEPGTLGTLGVLGLGALGVIRRRRRGDAC